MSETDNFYKVLLEEKDRQIQDYKNLFLGADQKCEELKKKVETLNEMLKEEQRLNVEKFREWCYDRNFKYRMGEQELAHINFWISTFKELTKPKDCEKNINVPGKKGHWVDDGDPSEWVCSECGYRVERHNNTPFCHHCGADMREGCEQDGET